MCSGMVSSSCSTSDTRRVNLVTNPVISHERGKEEEFEDTKGVIRMRISKKNRQHNDQKKKSTKGQTTIYKTCI